MDVNNEALEFAYLMEETHSTYQQIYVYTRAQDAYCATLDDEEPADSEAMFAFIRQHTNLSMHHIQQISNAQLKASAIDLSPDMQCLLIRKMVQSLSKKDKETIRPEFWETVLEYQEPNQNA